MRLMSLMILYLIILLLSSVNSKSDFDKECRFENTSDDQVLADCGLRNFSEIPSTTKKYQLDILDLRYNKIMRIKSTDFEQFVNIEELILKGNRIYRIDEGSFTKLNRLKKLDLSRNRIGHVSQRVIDQLPRSLTWISLEMNALSEIPALISFTNLIHLDFSHNRFISDISEDRLPSSLQHLHLHFTGISHFRRSSFRELSNLKVLKLNDNFASSLVRFEEGAFHDLSSLEYLSLSRTYCKNIPQDNFVALNNLTVLLLDNCWLRKVPVLQPSHKALRHLDLSGNRHMVVKSTTAYFPKSLEELHLSRVNIPEIDDRLFQNLTKLKTLDISESKVSMIHDGALLQLKNLQEIRLSKNPIKEIPKLPNSLRQINASEIKATKLSISTFDGMEDAVRIKLRNGQIDEIEDNAVVKLRSLQYLDLSRNRLLVLRKKSLQIRTTTTFKKINKSRNRISSTLLSLDLSFNLIKRIESGAFSSHTQLLRIDLQGNSLKAIKGGTFRHLWKLKELNLDNNNITAISPAVFQDLKSLEILRLQYNEIEIIEDNLFAALTNLKELYLRHNSIYEFNEASFKSLQHIDFSVNALTKLPKLQGPHIRRIEASTNYIKRITPHSLDGLSNLEQLYLNVNKIKRIPNSTFELTKKLAELDLTGNHLKTFITEYLPSLERLRLSENRISQIPANVNEYIPNIEYLSVRFNKLSIISPGVLSKLHRLEKVDISGNVFHCDCNMKPLATWIEINKDIFIAYPYYLCETPKVYYAMPFIDTIKKLNCSSKNFESVKKNLKITTNFNDLLIPICGSISFVMILVLLALNFRYNIRSFFSRSKKTKSPHPVNEKTSCKPMMKWCIGKPTNNTDNSSCSSERIDSNNSSTIVSAA